MDKDPQLEPPAEVTETVPSPEVEPKSIDSLPEALGFVEPQELTELRNQVIDAYKLGRPDASELAARYHEAAEFIVNAYEERQAYVNAQIGLIIRMGLIRRDGGNLAVYATELEDAFYYAWNERLDDLAAEIKQVWDEVLVEINQPETTEALDTHEPTGESIAEACVDVLPSEDCEELAAMSTEDALGYAFTLLLENGIEDPEAYLRNLGILL